MTFSAPKKQKGDLLKSEDWNALTAEVERLAKEKLDRNKTDLFSGSLKISENLAVEQNLEIKGKLSVSDPNQQMEISGILNVSNKLNIKNELKMTKGIIRRGGDNAITNTEDLGLYSQGLGQGIRIVTNKGDIRFFTDSNSGGEWDNAKLTISKDGKIGIGNTNPSEILEVKGTIKAESIVAINVFVVGMIIMWKGEANNVPKGWKLCDGSNETPDLRGKFIVGADDRNVDYKPTKTGGEEKVTLTIDQIPKHNHNSDDYKYLLKMDKNGTAKETDCSENEPNLYSAQPMKEVGGGKAHENRPPYYAICFIMYTGKD